MSGYRTHSSGWFWAGGSLNPLKRGVPRPIAGVAFTPHDPPPPLSSLALPFLTPLLPIIRSSIHSRSKQTSPLFRPTVN
jgi:hypothetical protein